MEKDIRRLSRLITQIESDPSKAREILKGAEMKDVPIIGVTGVAGVGKSTLVDAMIKAYREEGRRVAVIAVDPSSPFSGGAFLGDRIRMKRHFTDEGVFIRSMASRGALGGLNDAIFDVVDLIRTFDFDIIIVETVGAGQTEVDIAYVATTVLLILAPGGGDEVQMMKAGIMEIADIFVVNKADLAGIDSLILSLRAMLEISPQKSWKPPIVRTVATAGEGVRGLLDAVESHEKHLRDFGEIEERRKRSVKKHVEHIIRNEVVKVLENIDAIDLQDALMRVKKQICKGGV